jgi:O-antigen/teichoic acid export membrane protein
VKKLSPIRNTGIYANFFMATISLSGNCLWPVFDAFWTSFYNQNFLGVFSMAQRLQIAIAGLIITGMSTVLGTHFQNKTIDENLKTMKKMIFFVFLSSFFISICILCMYLLFSNLIKSLVPVSLDGIIPVFFILQTGMSFMIISTLLLRFYCSTLKYYTAAKIGIFFCILYFIFSGLLIRNYGINGMAFSYTLSWFLTALLFGWPLFMRKKLIHE